MDGESDLTIEHVEQIVQPEQAKMISELGKVPMPEFASNYLPLTDFYGIKDMNQENQEKLQTVWKYYAKELKEPGTVLKKIKQQHMNMMQPNIGDNALNQIYNYVRILESIHSAKEMKEAYEI